MDRLKGVLCLFVVSAVALCAPLGVALAEVSPLDKIISIDVKGADAVDILKMVAKFGGLSVVTDTTVKGALTADLKGLSVKQSLDVISTMNGWAWNRVGSTIVVGDANRVNAFQLPAMTVFQLKYASATDVSTKLGLAVAPEKVKVDARTNTLIVSGTEGELAKVRTLVDAMDVAVKAEAVVKPALSTRVKIQAIGGGEGAFVALVTVDGRSVMVMDGDKLTTGLSVNKVSVGEVSFAYEGEDVAIGMEGSTK